MKQIQQIDFTPLSQPLSKEDVALAGQLHANQNFFEKYSYVMYWIAGLPVAVFMAVTLGTSGKSLLIFISTVAFFSAISYQQYSASSRRNKKKYTLIKFAETNELIVDFDASVENKSGLLFHTGEERRLVEQLHMSETVCIGNYTFTKGGGKNKQTYTFGFIEISLPRNLPHMLLDAKANNFFGISNLPTSFNASQRMQLEGTFNSYFDLYVPQQYERDALYVFTPDIMQLALDHSDIYDIEVVDDRVYLYQTKFIDMTNINELKKILSSVTVISDKFERRVDYYADEKIADRERNVVADQGARLRKGIPLTLILIASVFIFFHFVLTMAPFIMQLFIN